MSNLFFKSVYVWNVWDVGDSVVPIDVSFLICRWLREPFRAAMDCGTCEWRVCMCTFRRRWSPKDGRRTHRNCRVAGLFAECKENAEGKRGLRPLNLKSMKTDPLPSFSFATAEEQTVFPHLITLRRTLPPSNRIRQIQLTRVWLILELFCVIVPPWLIYFQFRVFSVLLFKFIVSYMMSDEYHMSSGNGYSTIFLRQHPRRTQTRKKCTKTVPTWQSRRYLSAVSQTIRQSSLQISSQCVCNSCGIQQSSLNACDTTQRSSAPHTGE